MKEYALLLILVSLIYFLWFIASMHLRMDELQDKKELNLTGKVFTFPHRLNSFIQSLMVKEE